MTYSFPRGLAGGMFGLDLAGLFEDESASGLPEGFAPTFNFTTNIKGRSPGTLTYKTPKTPSGSISFELAPNLPNIIPAPAPEPAPEPAPAPTPTQQPTYAAQYQSIFSQPSQQYAPQAAAPVAVTPIPVAEPEEEDTATPVQEETPSAQPTYGSGLRGQIMSAGNVLSKKEATRIADATGKTVAKVMSKAQEMGSGLGSALVNAYSKGKFDSGVPKTYENLAALQNLQIPKGTAYQGASVYNVPSTSTRTPSAGLSTTPGYTTYVPIVSQRSTPAAARATDIKQFDKGGSTFGAAAVNRALESGLSAGQISKAAAAQGINLGSKAEKALKKAKKAKNK